MRLFGFNITRAVRNIAPGHRQTELKIDKPMVPPIGSEVNLAGFRYRVRKITDKDLVLRPIGNAK